MIIYSNTFNKDSKYNKSRGILDWNFFGTLLMGRVNVIRPILNEKFLKYWP